MRKLVCSLLFAGVLTSPTSYAQVITIGNGVGKDCYLATLHNTHPERVHERICDDALKSPGQTRQNLAANHINRGIIRMRMKNYEAALEDYKAAHKLRPDFGAIYLNEGAAMIGAGHPGDAIVSLKKALELETQDPHAAHYNLGLAYDLTGQVTEAYYAFKKAEELRPDWDLPKEQLERYSVVSTG